MRAPSALSSQEAATMASRRTRPCGVARSHGEQVGGVGDFFWVKAQHAGGGGAGLVLLRGEALFQKFAVGLVLRPGRPERFAEVVLVARVGLVERGGPGFDGGDDLAAGRPRSSRRVR
jgi:hypothetical protein